jgi:hypothetical protein
MGETWTPALGDSTRYLARPDSGTASRTEDIFDGEFSTMGNLVQRREAGVILEVALLEPLFISRAQCFTLRKREPILSQLLVLQRRSLKLLAVSTHGLTNFSIH